MKYLVYFGLIQEINRIETVGNWQAAAYSRREIAEIWSQDKRLQENVARE